jgi:homoserine/homoserine lactone efflux protein
MIELKIWVLILSFAIPMVVSPGPGNAILAAAGGKFGVRGTVPFWLGFEMGNLLWCLVYGFGLSQVFKAHPLLFEVLRWGSTLYVLYLAWCFFRSSSMSEQEAVKPLSFFDGFASLSLNPKVHSMILVMFSQFLNPELDLVTQVVQIATVFVLICFGCHFVWIYSGQFIFSRIKSHRAVRMQAIFFGMCMILVAASIAFS